MCISKFGVATAPSFLFFSIALTAQAQIIPDTTLPTNSIVSTDGNTSIITGGTQSGGNLFHSFEQFSIPTGSGAFFDNAIDIQNIFSRVTGNSISNIDGFLRANGTANLFLLNPNGIIFGKNASLELGGSFVGSTADRLLFQDGTYYSATETPTVPLLTINVLIGLQFGGNPGAIINRSQAVDSTTNARTGLQVTSGNTLALVGGKIDIEGGVMWAIDGRVELGSVGANSRVNLTARGNLFAFDYTEVREFQEIQLSQTASVVVRDFGRGGGLHVRGRRIGLTDNSVMGINNQSEIPGGDFTIVASDAIELNDDSLLASNAAQSGTGGAIYIETGRLSLQNGARLVTLSESDGRGGNLTVRSAESIEVSGHNSQGSPSALSVGASSTGDSGDLALATRQLRVWDEGVVGIASEERGNGGAIDITTERLQVWGGATVGNINFGTGRGSNLKISASEFVEVRGRSEDGTFPSWLAVGTQGAGNAGNLTIETGQLLILDGGQVSASTIGEGEGGMVTVRAKEVELSGNSFNSPSLLGVATASSGNAGSIEIETDRLSIREGAVISAATTSSGVAGEISVRANSIELDGVAPHSRNSSILAIPVSSSLIAGTLGEGNAGTITIETDFLSVRDGAVVAAATVGIGQAGSIRIRAHSIELSGQAATQSQDPSQLFAGTSGAGNAGNIELETHHLSVQDRARIAVNTNNLGRAGNIGIQAHSIDLNDGIFDAATTASGDAGSIRLEVEDLTLRNFAEVAVRSTSSGNPGSIAVSTDFLRLDNQGSFNASSSTGSGGNIDLAAGNIQLRHQSEITAAGSPNLPTSEGNIGINAETLVLLEGSRILTNSTDPQGGSNIAIAPLNSSDLVLLQSSDSRINARGELTISGEIQPEPANLPQVETTDAESLLSRGCQDYQGSSFYVTGRGGIPPSPFDPLGGSAVVEVDWVEASNSSEASRDTSTPTIQRPKSPLIEAQGWIVGENGEIILTAAPYQGTPYSPAIPTATCFQP